MAFSVSKACYFYFNFEPNPTGYMLVPMDNSPILFHNQHQNSLYYWKFLTFLRLPAEGSEKNSPLLSS